MLLLCISYLYTFVLYFSNNRHLKCLKTLQHTNGKVANSRILKNLNCQAYRCKFNDHIKIMLGLFLISINNSSTRGLIRCKPFENCLVKNHSQNCLSSLLSLLRSSLQTFPLINAPLVKNYPALQYYFI